MSITEDGIEAEKLVGEYLRRYGYRILQADWLCKVNGKWILVEVKSKSRRFLPPPFEGHGLDIHQINRRMEFYNDTGIRPYLFIIEKQNNNTLLGQYLDILNNGKYFDTRKNIRIYPIEAFKLIV